jgi:hypothetical protein
MLLLFSCVPWWKRSFQRALHNRCFSCGLWRLGALWWQCCEGSAGELCSAPTRISCPILTLLSPLWHNWKSSACPFSCTWQNKISFVYSCSHSNIEGQNVVSGSLLAVKFWFTLNIWNMDCKCSCMTSLQDAWTLCKLQVILLSSLYIPVMSEGQKADNLYVVIKWPIPCRYIVSHRLHDCAWGKVFLASGHSWLISTVIL